jgi:heme/copper-type cytochrome/quinol oxidase subunit 2
MEGLKMKQEFVTQAKLAGTAATGAGAATGLNQAAERFSLNDWATIASISVSCVTLIFVIAQLAYLIWKWRRQKNGQSVDG